VSHEINCGGLYFDAHLLDECDIEQYRLPSPSQPLAHNPHNFARDVQRAREAPLAGGHPILVSLFAPGITMTGRQTSGLGVVR
jgi:hypothetical protein